MTGITIIGAGNMAGTIGSRTVQNGNTVEVISRDAAKARALADRLGPGATTGTFGTAPASDIVVLAIPYPSVITVVEQYGAALAGKVIVDISNPFNADASELTTPSATSAAQEIAAAAPTSAHVVKAFNTVFGHVLAEGGTLDTFIAGDDPEAKASVSAFLKNIGLRPLDTGGLQMAQALEPLGLLLMGLARNGVGGFNFALGVDIH
jgi:8-hydroxy-5-deazaflavin:NADPH oxidoreductase